MDGSSLDSHHKWAYVCVVCDRQLLGIKNVLRHHFMIHEPPESDEHKAYLMPSKRTPQIRVGTHYQVVQRPQKHFPVREQVQADIVHEKKYMEGKEKRWICTIDNKQFMNSATGRMHSLTAHGKEFGEVMVENHKWIPSQTFTNKHPEYAKHQVERVEKIIEMPSAEIVKKKKHPYGPYKYICPVCKKPMLNTRSAIIHATTHGKIFKPEEIPINPEWRKPDPHRWKQHIAEEKPRTFVLQEKIVTEVEAPKKRVFSIDRKIECPYCGQKFFNAQVLRVHVAAKHPDKASDFFASKVPS